MKNTKQSAPFSGKLALPLAHPGEHILYDCLQPLGLSIAKGAEALGVTRAALNNIVRGKSGVSAEMAVRLSQAFGSTAAMWLRLQAAYDLALIEKRGDIHLKRVEAEA